MRFSHLFLGILTFSSCTHSPTSIYPRYAEFPEERRIETEVIPLDTILFRYPFRIVVKDSVALVMDLHNPDHFFHAFSYPAWKHLVSFGKRGESPEEILSAETFQCNTLDSIYVLDANRMQITRWSLSKSEPSASRMECISLDKRLIRSLDFYRTDSCFWIPDYSGEHRYWQVDFTGKALQSFGEIPTERKSEIKRNPALAQAWRSFIDYNPSNGVFALVTQLGETLEIYNRKKNAHHIVYGPEGEPRFREIDGEGFPNGIMGFSDIEVTKYHIYAVFHDVSIKEKWAAYQRGEHPEDGGRFLYVFDLQGTPVRKYILDRPVYSINIDEEKGIAFATCVESDEPILKLQL